MQWLLRLTLLLLAISPVSMSVFALAWEDSAMAYGPVHVHGHMVVHRRSFPGISDQELFSFGGVIHWEPVSFLSFGPYFRGLSSFVSGTETTSVTNAFNDVGLTLNIFPYMEQMSSGNIDVRVVATAGALLSIQKITFAHQLIATENRTETATSLVFPIEGGIEFIFSEHISFKYFVGYTLFAQAQGIYHGPALGVIF